MRLKTFAHRLLAGTLFFIASLANAGINTWTMTGPDSGWPLTIAIHPTNSQVSLASTVRGIYRTSDGGAHWTLVSEQVYSPRSIAFDPSDPNRVFAANSELWVSHDSGLTYALAQSPEFGVRQVEFSSAGVLYAQTLSARMFKSIDHGSTWTACGLPWGTEAASNSFAVDTNPNAQDHLFIEILRGNGASSGTWRSVDGCATWTEAGAASPASGSQGRAYRYSVMPGNPNRVLAATNLGVKLSTDGGITWSSVTAYPPVTVYPSWWVEYDRTSPGKAVAMVDITHIMRSADGGSTWSYGGAISAPGEASFALDPQVAGRMLVATLNGAYLSLDSGTSFVLRNKGMSAGGVSDFSVADDGTVYAAFYLGAVGVFRRDPQSGEWGPVNNDGLYLATISSTFGTTYVATAPTNSALLYVGNYYTSLTRSTNSGATWTQSHQAFLNAGAVPNQTVVDPDNALVAYTASSNSGMWKTIDGGVTWVQVNNGLPLGATVVAAARGANVVYAVAADPNILYPGAIYKSLNGGSSWSATGATPIAAGNGWFNALVIDPKNPNVVYAPYHNGVYKTTNGGDSWSLMSFPGVSDTLIYGWSVSIDPQFSSTVIVSRATDGSSIARTVDGGTHWERISIESSPQLPRTIRRALINPARPNQIIASIETANIAEFEISNDLVLSILGVPATVPTSGTVVALLNVENQGPYGASPSQAVITLPSWMTPTVPSTCTLNGQSLTCSVPALNFGQTYMLPLTLAVSGNAGNGQLTASLTTHEPDLQPANNSQSLTLTAVEQADLTLTLTPGAGAIDRGGTTTLTAGILNRGPSPSTATTVALQVPAGLTVQNVSTSRGTCVQNGTTVNCALGTMAMNATATVTLQLKGAAPGAYAVTGHLDGAGTDAGNDQDASANITVRPVGDLAVSIEESDDPVTVETPFLYLVKVHNNGPDSLAYQASVVVNNATPSSPTTDAGTCSVSGNNVTCGGSVSSAGTATISIRMNSDRPGIATATATVATDGTDSDATNNSATIGTTLRLVGDVSVELVDSADPVNLDAPFSYAVTVRNAGPNAGSVHLVVPVINATVGDATSTAAACTHTASSATCDIASLAAGATATINLMAGAANVGTASATATASFTGVDPDPANNSATANTTVRRAGDVAVQIAGSADPVNLEAPFSYTVTVRNAGPNAGTVQVVVPVINATVSDATSTAAACTHTASSATCDIASLAAGATSTIKVTAASAVTGPASATATASFTGFDPDPANNSAMASTTIRRAGDIAVEIVDSADPAIVGGTLNYTATVRNLGPNAGAAHLSVALTGGIVGAVTATNGGTCTNTSTAVECDFASLASDASATATIGVNTTSAGLASATANATFSGTDPITTNNAANVSTTINSPPSSSSSSSSGGGGGGGGGRFDWLALLLLGGLLVWRRGGRAAGTGQARVAPSG